MALIPYTLEQYQTLCAMIAKGVLSMEVNGEKVAFRSLAEMRQIRSEMERTLGLAVQPRNHYPIYTKG